MINLKNLLTNINSALQKLKVLTAKLQKKVMNIINFVERFLNSTRDTQICFKNYSATGHIRAILFTVF